MLDRSSKPNNLAAPSHLGGHHKLDIWCGGKPGVFAWPLLFISQEIESFEFFTSGYRLEIFISIFILGAYRVYLFQTPVTVWVKYLFPPDLVAIYLFHPFFLQKYLFPKDSSPPPPGSYCYTGAPEQALGNFPPHPPQIKHEHNVALYGLHIRGHH